MPSGRVTTVVSPKALTMDDGWSGSDDVNVAASAVNARTAIAKTAMAGKCGRRLLISMFCIVFVATPKTTVLAVARANRLRLHGSLRLLMMTTHAIVCVFFPQTQKD